MTETLYSRDILRLAVSIPHQAPLENPDGTADVRSKTCGSRVQAGVTLSDDERITGLGIEVNACALGQASTAIVAREAVGKSIGEIEEARAQFAAFLSGSGDGPGHWKDMDLLAVARDHPGRHGAMLLPYDAIMGAVRSGINNKRAA